ncbi:hypothetical protein Vretimale_373, partial [Volvox reticuliferus]
LCHDDACDHRMDRYAVSEMYCMMCGIRQPVGPKCCCCGVAMARYVCNICHLFDDEPGKDIYHCPFCNVCRYAAIVRAATVIPYQQSRQARTNGQRQRGDARTACMLTLAKACLGWPSVYFSCWPCLAIPL